MAPALAGSPRVNAHRDYIIKVVLKGLDRSGGRQDLHRHDDPDGTNSTTSGSRRSARYVRNNFGNSGGFVTPADVARVRAATADAQDTVDAAGTAADDPCTRCITDGWKLTASHNRGRGSRRA